MTDNPYLREKAPYERKEWLYEQYWGQMQTTEDIAADFDVSSGTVGRRMRELGVPRRRRNAVKASEQYDPRDEWGSPNTQPVTADSDPHADANSDERQTIDWSDTTV